MKERYDSVEMEVVVFNAEDIIRTSGDDDETTIDG